MVTAWYTLVVGILLTLNGIVFLMFSPDNFLFPKWYLGLLVLVGVIGIILGMINVVSKKKIEEKPQESPIEKVQ
jgi:hypothetical protein